MRIGVDDVNINESLGILYDSLFYNIVYFNRKAVETRLSSLTHEKTDVILYNYDLFRLKKNNPSPPDSLYPFFHYSEHFGCVLTKLLLEKTDFFGDAIQDFFQKLEDKRSLKRFVFAHYLHTFEGINMQKVLLAEGESVAKALTMLSQWIKIDHFYYMFYHFNQLVDELITYLKSLLIEIEKFHAKNKDKADIIHSFASPDTASQVKRVCKISDEVNLENQTYSVCYLAQYVIMRRSTKGKRPYAFALGCNFSDILFQSMNYGYITVYSVIKSFGNETKVDIIRELSKKEMTISQLSRKLHLSRSSIGRYVEDLVDEVAITRVKKVGADIYLRLNPEYLAQSKSVFVNYIDNILLELHANI